MLQSYERLQKLPKLDKYEAELARALNDREVNARVLLKAATLARKNRLCRQVNSLIPILEAGDFFNYALTITLKNRPVFPDRKTMIEYLWRRMENHFKDKCVRAPCAKGRGVALDAETTPPAIAQALNVISFQGAQLQERQHEEADLVRKFRIFLLGEEAALATLLDLTLLEGITNPRDQALKLNLPVDAVYSLRNKLHRLALKFGRLNKK